MRAGGRSSGPATERTAGGVPDGAGPAICGERKKDMPLHTPKRRSGQDTARPHSPAGNELAQRLPISYKDRKKNRSGHAPGPCEAARNGMSGNSGHARRTGILWR
ncbi:hypothetical protein Defa_00080 [Desulfovibrio sp. TH_2024_36128]|uniref:Uncharacterized protein n=1 Tax=Desulfovibrio falkowii TaxID=3136602 RepID=A0ABQ0E4H7_9BACT